MMTFDNLIAKLQSIPFNKVVRKNRNSPMLTSPDGWSLGYSIASSTNTIPTIRFIIQVRYKGNLVQTWGCESNAENNQFLKLFELTEYAISRHNSTIENEDSIEGRSLFNKL